MQVATSRCAHFQPEPAAVWPVLARGMAGLKESSHPMRTWCSATFRRNGDSSSPFWRCRSANVRQRIKCPLPIKVDESTRISIYMQPPAPCHLDTICQAASLYYLIFLLNTGSTLPPRKISSTLFLSTASFIMEKAKSVALRYASASFSVWDLFKL